MTTRCGTSWPRRRAGTTLIEALAGTVILGTLLVSVLMAKVRLEGQSRRAADMLQACAVMDGLLNEWWADPEHLPRTGEGNVPSHMGWRWRTTTLHPDDAEGMKAEVVAVEVFAPSNPGASQAAGPGAPAAARVELLMPRKDDEEAQTQPSPDAR